MVVVAMWCCVEWIAFMLRGIIECGLTLCCVVRWVLKWCGGAMVRQCYCV